MPSGVRAPSSPHLGGNFVPAERIGRFTGNLLADHRRELQGANPTSHVRAVARGNPPAWGEEIQSRNQVAALIVLQVMDTAGDEVLGVQRSVLRSRTREQSIPLCSMELRAQSA